MRNNYMLRTLALLVITFIGCYALSFLPDALFGLKIKKVDLLSDLRTLPEDTTLAMLRTQLEAPPLQESEDIIINTQTDTVDVSEIQRDSLAKLILQSGAADPAGARIEDYSKDHTGLKRFFEALRNSGVRPVRIAFLGDSFIEGDILVADFRNSLQKMYGGHGAGFVPIASAATQYRSTVSLKSTGWKAYSILNDKQYPYTLSGMLFEPSSGTAEIRFQTGKAYSSLKSVNSLKFIYDRNEATTMQFASNASDTITAQLPPTDIIYQYTFDYDSIHSGTLSFANAQNLRALGVVLEDNTGITVDNFSLRGNSGMSLIGLDVDACKAMGEIRSYDLIILQYGLNVADASMLDYGWYRSRMNDVINHLRQCFPNSDFLLLSVSDRGNQYNGEFKTMPAILALLNTQRKIAQQTQIPFWNMFGAMGGENSIVRFVNNGWAGKDYTHLTFRGGTEISQRLIKALMQEKELYE